VRKPISNTFCRNLAMRAACLILKRSWYWSLSIKLISHRVKPWLHLRSSLRKPQVCVATQKPTRGFDFRFLPSFIISSVITIVFILNVSNNVCYALATPSVNHPLNYGLRSAQRDLYPWEVSFREIIDNCTLRKKLTKTGLVINRGGRAISSVRLCIRVPSVESCTPKQPARSHPLLPLVVRQVRDSRPFEKYTSAIHRRIYVILKRLSQHSLILLSKNSFMFLAYYLPESPRFQPAHKKSPTYARDRNFGEALKCQYIISNFEHKRESNI